MSHPENGVISYGLSTQGELEVKTSIENQKHFNTKLQIVSSDFKRARESAEIVHRFLNTDTPIKFDNRLRERNFGDLELKLNDQYERVWESDKTDPDHNDQEVESANQVMSRATSLVKELELSFNNETFLLVSHGDTLQILETAFHQEDASRHRSEKHLETGQIRHILMDPSE